MSDQTIKELEAEVSKLRWELQALLEAIDLAGFSAVQAPQSTTQICSLILVPKAMVVPSDLAINSYFTNKQNSRESAAKYIV